MVPDDEFRTFHLTVRAPHRSVAPMSPNPRPPRRHGILHRPHRTHAGARLRHRQRGHSTLRNSTAVVIAGGLVIAGGFSLLAFRATQDQDAARAAARARLLAYEHRQHDLRLAAQSQLRAQQAAARAQAERSARRSALRAAQFAALRRSASSAAAQAAAQAAAAQSAAAQAAASTAAAASSSASSAASATAVAASTPPVASSGGS
jgi:hypothetical protein